MHKISNINIILIFKMFVYFASTLASMSQWSMWVVNLRVLTRSDLFVVGCLFIKVV